MDKCEFSGCVNPLDERWQPKDGKKLCRQHSDEFEALVKADDIAGMMRFFVQSNTATSDSSQLELKKGIAP